ncbi:hypothetical protein HSBAA_50100 [Vreelandella sulfidaeris]|uniref:Uncharacterized protein n=1 Tax=Vreelandella sulfidaeris TaxID=115553 RepID=A0A455UL79_9GAMM|nr:hypothetical protein HSBAA_50100 [Halomonas sulfidaeris]
MYGWVKQALAQYIRAAMGACLMAKAMIAEHVNNMAMANIASGTLVNHSLKLIAHCGEPCESGLNFSKMMLCQCVYLAAGHGGVIRHL